MGSKEVIQSPDLNKIPPQNIEAEQAVLGAMLLNEKIIPEILEIIDSTYFYKEDHKDIFSVITTLFHNRKNIDIVTVSEELKKKAKLQGLGGVVYLTNLVDNVPATSNASSYAKIVKEKGILRSLISSSFTILSSCYEARDDASTILDKSERLIFEISDRRIEGGYVHIKEIIKSSIELIDSLYQKKSHVTGIPTGFKEFDIKTSGFHPGDLVVIAGRPSMGKSALVSCIAEFVAVEKNEPVGFFSLEMSREQLVQRFLCSHAKVDAHKLRTGFLSPSDWPLLTSAAGRLSEAPLFIDDTPAINIFELRAKARRMRSHQNIKLVIIDYLQLIKGSGRIESRQQEISAISQALKALAKELDVPVIAVSQLSREVEKREDHKPRLSDLRESGAIEQDADLVALLYREDYYDPDSEKKGIAELNIAKQRNGPTGIIDVGFVREYMKFVNLDFTHIEEET
ncbi:MAG: replicative DNA helicase [Candidatus Omnitrophica bacterium]|nr:replicative DNA helicase [Candidatus Omnitrophota bacterium]